MFLEFLIYGMVRLKIFSLSILLGLSVFLYIVYYVYGWIFKLFFCNNKLFYKKRYISYITRITDDYWLDLDPEEVKCREEKDAKEAEQSNSTSFSSSEINRLDSDN